MKKKRGTTSGKSDGKGLRVIAAFKLVKGLLLVAVGIGAIKLLHKDVSELANHWITELRVDPDNRLIHGLISKLGVMNDHKLEELSIGSFFYAALLLTEGIGLWLKKRWAEYFTIIATCSLIPLELYEIAKRVTVTRFGALRNRETSDGHSNRNTTDQRGNHLVLVCSVAKGPRQTLRRDRSKPLCEICGSSRTLRRGAESTLTQSSPKYRRALEAKPPDFLWRFLMTRLRQLFLVAIAVMVAQSITLRSIASAESSSSPVASLPSFAEPALSPDRAEIAFVSGGDVWTVPSSGGEARLLVSHPATESRPLYSPDGRKLAFVSNRTGGGDIYILRFDSGELQRLTFDDGLEQLDGWSRDGRWIYFSSTSHDVAGMNDLYRVSVDGGTPMQVSADRYASEYFSSPSPDGKTVAFTARGIASSQWWRKGHSHLDECEIWVMRDAQPPTYERVTEGGAKEMWPMWSADGASIFYVSDRSGAQNIWTINFKSTSPRQITKFKDGRVLWPNISYDGKAIVFERNFAIWKLDPASGQATEVPITRRGAPAGPSVEHLRLTDQIQELALSPDGKKVAFVVRGEVFAASAKDGGDAARVTNSPSDESQIAWAPDSRRLAYVSDRDGASRVFVYDFESNKETQLTNSALEDAAPSFSPDGKYLAFERDARELRVINLDSKTERLLSSGVFERPPISAARPFVFSPDSKWIAFTSTSGKSFSNVSVVATAGGEAKQISFLANVFNNTVSWSPDGTNILFDTAQRTEGGQVARIDLTPRTPRFREDQFRDLFKEEPPRTTRPRPAPQEDRPTEDQNSPALAQTAGEKKPPRKPVEIVFDDIKSRLSLLPAGVDVGAEQISPDGKWLLMSANAAGQQNLYIYSLDELAREPAVARQLTSTPGFKRDAQFSPDSKEVFYLVQGRINVVPLDTRNSRALVVTAEMDVDFAREKTEVFNQAWSYLRDSFFDPNFNGIDWGAIRSEYAPRIAGARTSDEMRRLLSLMVGELNASQ